MPDPNPSYMRDREPSDFVALSRSVLMDDIDFQWQDADLAGLLRHQLATPLANDLPGAAAVCPDAAARLGSFGGLFAADSPPRELLDLARLYAKSAAIDRHRPLQREVALVLYFAAIAAGRVKLGLKLTSKGDAELVQAYRWALDRPWLARELVPLFEAAVAAG